MTVVDLRFLGSFEVVRDGIPVTRFRGDKVRALLAYLATESDRPHARAALAALLWPEQPDELALRNLSQALVRLRAALGDDSALLHSSRHALQWQSSAASVDVQDVARLARGANPADLAQAADLYRGEFLAGFALPGCEAFEEWLVLTREQLHTQALDLLAALATHHEQAGDYPALCFYARRQIALEAWHEAAQRQLMRGLALLGDRTAALAQYERCRATLANELGVEPDPETRALYERIRAGEHAPTIRSASSVRHNLPAPLTPFVGRETELAELAALQYQPGMRLLTLVGAGGMGKTRLALEIARAGLDAYPDGVFFVALAPLAAASELPSTVAQALGLQLQASDPTAALLQILHHKRMLLVLDNFEHVLAGVALVVAIMQAAPDVQIIVTSRERLHVRGEQRYEVTGLPYTDALAAPHAPSNAAACLFLQSVRRIHPAFNSNAANRALILRICQLVQGMPLALELAAAWAETLPLEEIANEIARSADFLAVDWPDAPPRQRSMRAIFDWSWQLLTAEEQRSMRQLSIYRGGFTRAAAQAVTGTTLSMLSRLVQKSLVRASTGRYEIHELVRQFAAEHLDACDDERALVQARYSTYYLAYIAARERQLARDDPRTAVADIQSEIDNIFQAWVWAARDVRLADLDRSAYAIWQFHAVAGSLSNSVQLFELASEGIQNYLQTSVDAAQQPAASALLSKVLAMRASHLLPQGNQDQALALAEQAIALGQHARASIEGLAIGRLVQGQALRRKGHSDEARDRLVEAARLAQQQRVAGADHEALPDVEWRAYNWLCSIALTQDDYATARHYAEAGVLVCRALGKRIGELACLTDIVDIALASGDYQAARRETEYMIQLAQTIGYQRGLASMHATLGQVARLQGEYSYAALVSLQGRAGCQAVGDILRESYAVHTLAYLHLFMGDYGGAQRWLSSYDGIMQAAEMPAREVFLGLLPRALLAHTMGEHEQALAYAQQACQMAQQLDGRSSQANALVMLGMAYAGATRLDQAATAYRQALTIYAALGHTHLAVEPHAGLAQLALERGDLPLARQYLDAIMPTLAQHPRAGLHEPFAIYLTCYHILVGLDDPRAISVAQQAHSLLQAYADQITDATLRQSFLENVPTHRALLRVGTSLASA